MPIAPKLNKYAIQDGEQVFDSLHQSPPKDGIRDIEDQPEITRGADELFIKQIEVEISSSATFRKYAFKPFYHPYVCAMIKQLNRYGIGGLLDPKPDSEAGLDLLRQQAKNASFDFETYYQPTNDLVDANYPKEGFDFDFDSPYGIYNWELFFHAPLHIATHLTQNQKFEDAQKWLHYIFNPTEVEDPRESDGVTPIPAPARFWKVKPFFEYESQRGATGGEVAEVLAKMSEGSVAFQRQLDQWMKNPFQPHTIARLRVVAYMKSVVMKYIDNLIQWGDSLFRRDTIESINEATQLYLLASQILGPKPVRVQNDTTVVKSLGDVVDGATISDSIVDMESELGTLTSDQDVDLDKSLNAFNSVLLFCTQPNEKLLEYWDTVADRLFKIRHCMNIEGVTRTLALFEPPIDPALLVRASAAGLDINAVLNDISGGSIPHYRFRVLIQKAQELCSDVKSLGQSLLSAMEKRDAEELAQLRAGQEVTLLKAIRQIKKQSIAENQETIESLKHAKELAEIRKKYYSSRKYMNRSEKQQLKRMDRSLQLKFSSQGVGLLAGVVGQISDFEVGLAGAFGSPFVTASGGGNTLFRGLQGAMGALNALSEVESNKAAKSGIKGGYERRKDDWQLQVELAEKELEQIERQITGAEIRLAISERDLENQDMQIEQSSEVQKFMKDKYTNKDLYNWMSRQISSLYFQSYQLAYDVAKMAEKSFEHELAKEDTTYIKFGHWDSLKAGLLAGEKLQGDLRRLEVAHLEQNQREYELTKHVPLSMLSPNQLIDLRETGTCEFYIPEVLFDLDQPGQYMRRIKSVRLTIPAVTGPYTNVNAKLTLLANRRRKNTKDVDTAADYAWSADDSRFVSDVGGIQAVAISSAQNDAGLFELNFQDERYLPFEGAGAISHWRLELPAEHRQFDYDTISDVVVHISYTAREGGNRMKAAAVGNIEAGLNAFANELADSGQIQQKLFSLKTHFPNALRRLLQPISDQDYQEAQVAIKKEHFPYFLKNMSIDSGAGSSGALLRLIVKQKDGASINLSTFNTLNATVLDSQDTVVGGATAADTALVAAVAEDPIQIAAADFTPSTANTSWLDTFTIRFKHSTPAQLENVLNSSEIEDIYLLIDYSVSTPS
ncbi:MAG: hypothetical protein JXR03_01545 [Cyclobacteriaceae bacterium]